jgi:hypothetical protein
MNRYGTTLLRRLLPLSILTLAALAGCDNHDLSTGPAPGRVYGAETAPGACVVENTADDGAGSLRAAIGNAACTSISFDAALSGQTITLTSGELVIDRALTITGPGASQLAVSGGDSSRVARVGYGIEASISGLTITGGSDMSGGGIYNYGTLTLADCVVTGNRATSNGGGIHNEWNSVLTVTDCSVADNAAYDGGGIANTEGQVTLDGSTVSNNTAVSRGGGIFMDRGVLLVRASTISGNSATTGGAIYSYSYSGSGLYHTTILNSTISGNAASYRGGGVYNQMGPTRVILSTITANQAAAGGGGIFSNNDSPAQTEAKGSIIWGNRRGSISDDVAGTRTAGYGFPYTSLGYNLVGAAGANVDFSQEFNETTDQTGVADAVLGPLYLNAPGATRTHALLTGSPALEAGTCQDLDGATVATDQRGVSRPQGALCDIGAYEGVGTVPSARLVVTVSGEGTVVSEPAGILCGAAGGDCEAGFDFGSVVTLTATAARGGWKFAGWSGAAVGSTSPAVLTMDGPKAVAATFVKGGGVSPVLAVVVTGPGRVTSSPEGIDCTASGGTCSAVFSKNTTVWLTAIPDGGAAFGGWGGSASGVDNPLQVRISGDLNVTALFGALNGPVVGVNAGGTVDKRTGAATITGTASCSDPGNIAITVQLQQTQTTGKTTTTVAGLGEADPTWCGVDTPWSVIVTPAEGSKFVAGSAVATVHSPGATTVTQTVNLK